MGKLTVCVSDVYAGHSRKWYNRLFLYCVINGYNRGLNVGVCYFHHKCCLLGYILGILQKRDFKSLLTWQYRNYSLNIRPQGYKNFFMLNSAEHEIFSANKYENVNNIKLQLLVIWSLVAGQISCSAELSMKKFSEPKNMSSGMCAKRSFRSACAFAGSDQNILWVHLDNQWCNVSSCGQRRLIRLRRCNFDLSLCLDTCQKVRFLTYCFVYSQPSLYRHSIQRQNSLYWQFE